MQPGSQASHFGAVADDGLAQWPVTGQTRTVPDWLGRAGMPPQETGGVVDETNVGIKGQGVVAEHGLTLTPLTTVDGIPGSMEIGPSPVEVMRIELMAGCLEPSSPGFIRVIQNHANLSGNPPRVLGAGLFLALPGSRRVLGLVVVQPRSRCGIIRLVKLQIQIRDAVVQHGIGGSAKNSEFCLGQSLIRRGHGGRALIVDTHGARIVSTRKELDRPPVPANVGRWRAHDLGPVGAVLGTPDTFDLPGYTGLLDRLILGVFEIGEDCLFPMFI